MDNQDRRDLIGHLFALVTARLEDAATLAVDGQAADPAQVQPLAAGIRRLIDEAYALIGAIEIV